MVQSISIKNKYKFIKNHLFSVVQWLSLIFIKNKSFLIFISDFMSHVRILKTSVFPLFEYGVHNVIEKHLFSVVQWLSLIFLKNESYLIFISDFMSDVWIVKKWFPIIWVWSTQWCNLFLLKTNICSLKTICSVLFSDFPSFSLKIKVSWYFLRLHEWCYNYKKKCFLIIWV